MNAEITPQEYEAFKKFLQDACGILLARISHEEAA